jgi:hypothetical protein
MRDINELPDHWIMYFDRSYTLKGAGAIQLEFPATNNITEYKGLVNGLWLEKDLGIRRLLIRGDSHLVAKHVQKVNDCNNDIMTRYLAEVCRMEKFSMDLKYDMSHIWTIVMLIIWPGLLPPGHRPHRMLLLRDYLSLR